MLGRFIGWLKALFGFLAGRASGRADVQAAEVQQTEKLDEKVAHAADAIPSAGDSRALADFVREHDI